MSSLAFQALFSKNSFRPTFSTKLRLKEIFASAVQMFIISNNDEKVLNTLLHHWTEKGCFPSQATIASHSGLTDRTVRNSLSKLKNIGWISWRNTRIGRRQSSNRYIFTITQKIIDKILDAIKAFKKKTAEIRGFYRRKNVPPSASFILNNRRISMNSSVKSIAKNALNGIYNAKANKTDNWQAQKTKMQEKLRALI